MPCACTNAVVVPCLLATAVVVLVASLGMRDFLTKQMYDGVVDQVVIDSKKATGFNTWAHQGGAPIYLSYYFWNMTNAEAVVERGEKPILNQLGPYCYQRVMNKFDLKWTESGDKVTRNYQWIYHFDPGCSDGAESDMITNLSPSYLGVIAQAGGELQMTLALSGPTIKNIIDRASGRPLEELVAGVSATLVGDTYTALLSNSPSSSIRSGESSSVDGDGGRDGMRGDNAGYWKDHLVGGSDDSDSAATVGPAAAVLNTWANATDAGVGVWKGFHVSVTPGCTPTVGDHGDTKGNCVASGIGAESARRLFDPNAPLSLTNTTATAACAWSGCSVGGGDGGEGVVSVSNARLCEVFGLTEAQVHQIKAWLTTSLSSHIVLPFLNERYGVTYVSQLVMVQWARGGVWGSGGWHASHPNLFPLPYPELSVYAADHGLDSRLSRATATKLLNGTFGIFNPLNVQPLSAAIAGGDFDYIFETWGLNADDAATVAAYLAHLTFSYTNETYNEIVAARSGLVATRTLYEWLWDFDDRLLDYFQPAAPNARLQLNMTSHSFARKYGPQSDTLYTGKFNLSQVSEYYKYENSSWLVGWAEPIHFPEYYGGTAFGQFTPFLTKKQQLYPFDVDFQRTTPLVNIGEVDLRGVTLWRYILNNKTLAPDPFYFQSIRGFVNVSSFHAGAPVFLSPPHMWSVPSVWVNKVVGQHPSYNLHATKIDVEPNLGTVMRAFETLQINVYVAADSQEFNAYHPLIRKGLFYPVFWVNETVTATAAQTKQWRDTYILASHIHTALGYVAAIVPALCVLGVGGLAFRHTRAVRSHGYRPVAAVDADAGVSSGGVGAIQPTE